MKKLKIKIRVGNKVNSFKGLFKNCFGIESICFKKFYSQNIINELYVCFMFQIKKNNFFLF